MSNVRRVETAASGPRLLFVLNSAQYFLSHRLPIASAAARAGYDVHVAAPLDPAMDIESKGFQFHPFPLSRRSTNPVVEFRSVSALTHLYTSLKPNLVHHLTIKPMLYGGVASRRSKVPAVVHAVAGLGHVFTAEGVRAGIVRAGVKAAYRAAFQHPNRKVIFQNPDDRDMMISAGIIDPESAVLIRGSGVDIDQYPRLPEPNGDLIVLLASRMLWPKGIGEFVEAARRFRSEGTGVRFVLAGDTDPGNPAAVPHERLEAWSKEGIVEWWGFQSDMVEVFRNATIICLPSSYGEGVPKVLIEAAACGRPIVTTDSPGCREIVRDGVNGLLVPRKDPAALAAALKRLIADAGLRRAFGDAGRAIVVNEFSEELVIKQTLQVYQELLERAEQRR